MAELHPKNDEAAEIVGAERADYCAVCAVPFLHHYCLTPRPILRFPDMRTPAMVVKMIEWLIADMREDVSARAARWTDLGFALIYKGRLLTDALILAVISTKESTDGKS